MLTTLFTGRIENWTMSPSVFDNIDSKTKKAFEEYILDNPLNLSAYQETNFNIF